MCTVKYEGEYFEQHGVKKEEEDDVKIKTETYDWENSNSSVELGREENNATNMPVKLHQKLMSKKEEEHKETDAISCCHLLSASAKTFD